MTFADPRLERDSKTGDVSFDTSVIERIEAESGLPAGFFMGQHEDAVAAIKIARSYLEKRCCIADGTADRDLFHDINAEALGYYNVYPLLTHLDLLMAASAALEETA